MKYRFNLRALSETNEKKLKRILSYLTFILPDWRVIIEGTMTIYRVLRSVAAKRTIRLHNN